MEEEFTTRAEFKNEVELRWGLESKCELYNEWMAHVFQDLPLSDGVLYLVLFD